MLARLGRRPAVHQGLLAPFAVFGGSLFAGLRHKVWLLGQQRDFPQRLRPDTLHV